MSPLHEKKRLIMWTFFSVLDERSQSNGSDHTPDPLQWGIWPQTATLLQNGSGDPNGVLGQQSRP